MNKYTVIYAHTLPLAMGVAAYHLAHKEDETPEQAAEKCKRELGGFATILVVFEGHLNPVLMDERVWTKEKFEQRLKEEFEQNRKDPNHVPLAAPKGKPCMSCDRTATNWTPSGYLCNDCYVSY